MTKKPNRGLGRGLSALMADVAQDEPVEKQSVEPSARRIDQLIPIERIFPNPEQPRRRFTQDDLEDLAASIKEKGIIQPLIVRANPRQEGTFEIVAGERRWRAAQIAQLHEIPVLIRDYSDTEALEVAIIENIQRADLNAIEEAAGYRDLMERFGHTQEKLSEALGKSRSHIANMVRLLSLPQDVQALLETGALSAGHARALITSNDPSGLAKQVISKGLSVRDTEKLAKSVDPAKKGAAPKVRSEKDADTVALEKDLTAALGMNVVIDHKAGQENGALTIRYRTLDDLDDLCRKLGS
jgi:ParB family chromosome partitioning protein